MIADYLAFLDYYQSIILMPPDTPRIPARPYESPLTRIEYDAIDKNGQLVLAILTPYSHAVRALCYREPEEPSPCNQKIIAQICCVSEAEVSAWKKEERIPEKYRWFLLLVQISQNARSFHGDKMLHPASWQEAELICDFHLRMVQSCFDPFCQDDRILAEAVRRGQGIEPHKNALLEINPAFWSKIFKIHNS